MYFRNDLIRMEGRIFLPQCIFKNINLIESLYCIFENIILIENMKICYPFIKDTVDINQYLNYVCIKLCA